jgi:hypothetical protein
MTRDKPLGKRSETFDLKIGVTVHCSLLLHTRIALNAPVGNRAHSEPNVPLNTIPAASLNVSSIKNEPDVFYCQLWVLLLLSTGIYSIFPTGFTHARFLA